MEETVKAKVKARFPQINDRSEIFDQLSSIELVEFVAFLEEEFSVRFLDLEYSAEIFSSFRSIAEAIERKRARA